MKRTLEPCPHCGNSYYHSLSLTCPFCGRAPERLHSNAHPGWGGKRHGAGAPVANLNRLIHGGQSKLLKRGIEKLARDPEMRAVLYIIARLASQGKVPPQTKRTITAAIRKGGVS